MEDVLGLMKIKRLINELDFTDIKWTLDDKELVFDKEIKENFEMVGLTNIYFGIDYWEARKEGSDTFVFNEEFAKMLDNKARESLKDMVTCVTTFK